MPATLPIAFALLSLEVRDDGFRLAQPAASRLHRAASALRSSLPRSVFGSDEEPTGTIAA
jgi:hypothetical protein